MSDPADAVLALARDAGVTCHNVLPLRSTNNAVFLLERCDVVAKVHGSEAAATRELATGHVLAAVGAPIVRPAAGIGDHVRSDAGLHVTFWAYAPDTDTGAPSSGAVAVALDELHRHLACLADRIDVRAFGWQLDEARRALQSPAFARRLDLADRRLLHDVLTRAIDESRAWAPAVLHGSPHRLNILVLDDAPVFIDLETIQFGPIEWDLAHLEVEVAHAYREPYDYDLLAKCRTAVSAATAAWCWDALERGPDMRTHAEHHLAVVRSTT